MLVTAVQIRGVPAVRADYPRRDDQCQPPALAHVLCALGMHKIDDARRARVKPRLFGPG
jgi:hypothetical protein